MKDFFSKEWITSCLAEREVPRLPACRRQGGFRGLFGASCTVVWIINFVLKWKQYPMDDYQKQIRSELTVWQKQMLQRPSLVNRLSKAVQVKINTWIPEKVHQAITATIKQMIRGVLFGATHTTAKPLIYESLQACEVAVQQRIEFYRTTAAFEGGITGAGGILLGFADFPILIGLKLKLLFDISSTYGLNVADYKERVYLLHIFELAFSSHEHRRNIYLKMVDWDQKSKELPEDIHQFDWRNFQQEYRDYIDLAKMAQLIPIIGAPVGFVVNSKLIEKLGITAMNAYRMRLLKNDVNLKHL